MFYKIIIFLLEIFVKIFFPFKTYDIENFKNLDDGFILCSNHVSNIDPIFFMIIHYRLKKKIIYFLAKKELFKWSIVGFILKKVGAIPILRGSVDHSALDFSSKVLHEKNELGIFIEGKRSKTGEFLKPRSGAALLAIKANVPILPVCITPSKNKIKFFSKTNIKFGKPIILEETATSIKEIKKISNIIMTKIKTLRNF